MDEFLSHPAVQAGVAPFVVGLVVALIAARLRVGGLAATAGFLCAVGLVAGFTFSPLTATRKIVLLALITPVIGIVADFAIKPSMRRSIALALVAAIVVTWIFWPVLAQKEGAVLLGITAAGLTAWLVGYVDADLHARPLENAVTALCLGLGAGILAIFGASASLGQYGIALGAGAGAFLLVMMIANRTFPTGATLGLPAAVLASALAVGAMVLAQLQWYAVLVLGLVPLAARIPLAPRAPIWLRAVMTSLVAIIPVIIACFVAYQGSR